MSEPMTPPPAPGQKKMSALGWIAIGCGAIAILGILAVGAMVAAGGWFFKKQVSKFEENPAVAAAELAIRANSDVELVESDIEKGTITYRDKKSGEVVTINAGDVKEDGKFTITTKDGTSTFDASSTEGGGTLKVTNEKGEEAVFGTSAGAPKNLPSWLPTYPGAKVEGSMDATSQQERSAAFTVTTTDSVQEVMEFYESRLRATGLSVQKTSFETNGAAAGGTVTGTSEDQKRTVNVMVSAGEGQTSAVVTFAEKQ